MPSRAFRVDANIFLFISLYLSVLGLGDWSCFTFLVCTV